MASFNTIKVGDILFDCHKVQEGNTTRRRMACFEVRVISIDSVTRTAMCSWNYNTPTRFSELRLKRLRRSKVKK